MHMEGETSASYLRRVIEDFLDYQEGRALCILRYLTYHGVTSAYMRVAQNGVAYTVPDVKYAIRGPPNAYAGTPPNVNVVPEAFSEAARASSPVGAKLRTRWTRGSGVRAASVTSVSSEQ